MKTFFAAIPVTAVVFFGLAPAKNFAAENSPPSSVASEANVRDVAGNTLLHLAALRGDADAVDALLGRGADAKAINHAGATPLHYGVGNERIVTALLAHGAPAEAVSKLSITPLLGAVAYADAYPVVQRLIAAGAKTNHGVAAPGTASVSGDVLASAVRRGDLRVIALLIERGAEVNPASGPLPLTGAAQTGNLELIELLLKHGADPNLPNSSAAMPLPAAVNAHQYDAARLLLEHGANPNTPLPDRARTPPMALSGHTDTGDPAMARLLVERGADVNSADEHGVTALSYALKGGSNTPLVAYLREAGGRAPATPERGKVVPSRAVPTEAAARETMIRASAQRAIDLLQSSSRTFLATPLVRDQRQCTSCHHEALPAVGYALARERGLRVDPIELGRTLQAMSAEFGRAEEGARQMGPSVPAMRVILGYRFDAFHALGYPRDATTDVLSRQLLALQDQDGAWRAYVPRGPMEDDLPVNGTAWSVRAIQLYPPIGMEREVERALDRARVWLKAQPAKLFNEQLFQLLGLAWTNASVAEMGPFAERLIQTQGRDGGWTQVSGLPPDAWATGSALVALRKAGIAPSHAAYRSGVDFLLRTQFEDGSWWVRSRTWPTQAHFDSKFPHGKDQWISAAGTAWAVIAMLQTIEPTARPESLPNAQQLIASFLQSPAGKENASAARAAKAAAPEAPAFDFARDIRPVLERSCIGCHSGARPKGGLDLTKREGFLKGGQSGGPAIIPGYAEDSPLVHQVSDEIEDLEMPPLARREKYPALSKEEIARLRTWIDAGAPWKDARVSN